ncbi:MAG: hypothetical protein DWG76_01460 [Chloroflexi bacterium]|nr:hypothetical protein [Chloroflexota bacterium]
MQRELRRAIHLMHTGAHLNAAQIFTSLAQRAQDRAILGPASMLFIQSGLAYLYGAQGESGVEQAYNGLKLLAAEQHLEALQREGGRFVTALEEQGLTEEATELRAWLSGQLGDHTHASKAEHKYQVPEQCPYCGASMSLEQLSGLNARAAECHYCGSVVRSTQMD